MNWRRRKPEPQPEGVPPDRLAAMVGELANLTDRFQRLAEESKADAVKREHCNDDDA